MIRLVPVVATLSLAFTAVAAQAQSLRPPTEAPLTMPVGDDYEVPANLPFTINIGGSTQNQILLSSNAGFRTLDVLSAFPAFIDDLDIRTGVGTATYDETVVDGRSAFIATFVDVGYSPTRQDGSLPTDRARVQLVLIDRSDVAPGDFDLEINGEGLAYPSSSQSIRINGGSAGRAGVGVIPAGPGAYRLLWNFRGGALVSGVGPVIVPVLSVTSTPPGAASAGGSYEVTTSSDSPAPVVLTVDPASDGICAASGTTISLIAEGNCTFFVNQAATTGYAAAEGRDQTFYVGAPAPVPTLSEWAMILLGTLLAGGAALRLQERRVAG
ncbi:IPTL-CTERM sorting domain-containing protein [Brevundimonas sp.]